VAPALVDLAVASPRPGGLGDGARVGTFVRSDEVEPKGDDPRRVAADLLDRREGDMLGTALQLGPQQLLVSTRDRDESRLTGLESGATNGTTPARNSSRSS
jgi:hypothetical protein